MIQSVISVIVVCFFFFWYLFVIAMDSPSPPPPHEKSYRLTDTFLETTEDAWHFSLPPEYYILDDTVRESDECLGKNDGVRIEAKGKRLYDFIRKEKLKHGHSQTFRTNVDRVVQSGRIFYFKCQNNKIADLHACLPGNVFNVDQCTTINTCTNALDGTQFPDKTDRHFYFQCQQGIAERRQCPDDSFYYLTGCTSKSNWIWKCEFESENVFPINEKTYVRCGEDKKPVFHTCPDGMHFFKDRCESNECVGHPDGLKATPPQQMRGPFLFSRGYIECRGGRVEKRETCPELWDHYSSKRDNLTILPSVFDGKMCSPPTFCENVQPTSPDVIVPVHDFTKYIPDSPISVSYDEAVGIRCEGHRPHRIVLDPGMRVSENFRIEPGCSSVRRRVAIGDVHDQYYDCDSETVMPCPPNTFFNGTECQEDNVPHAHRYKNIPIFKMTNLSPLNDWMMSIPSPRTDLTEPSNSSFVYVPGYDVWSDRECSLFPFLMQVKHAFFLPDGKHYCQFKDGKIRKRTYLNAFRLKFWSQRFVPDDRDRQDECYPGMKIRKGRFEMDSIFYATCDKKQPFVFCPSASTEGIERTEKGIWACKPYSRVYKGVLPAGQTMKISGLKSIVPQASYKINGESFKATTIEVSILDEEITLWSEGDVTLYFKKLPTYPPFVYLENEEMKLTTDQFSSPFHDTIFTIVQRK